MKQCKFCKADTNDFVTLNPYADYSGIEIAINRQGLLRVRYYGDSDNFESQDILTVRYCPICGRRFTICDCL